MKTILAVAALFFVAACQTGDGYGPPPMMYGPPPFQVPTNWQQHAPKFGPVLTCSRLGNFINCY
jgi:hypothetical protein